MRSGTASVLVVKTGPDTAVGSLAARLAEDPPETDFARGVRHFGYLLLRVMLVIVLFVLMINQWLGRPALDSLLFAVALAVGLSPELLPAILSVNLARGAQMMADRGVLVRRLSAIENLGSMTVLCTDKTGTLTEGRPQVVEILALGSRREGFAAGRGALAVAFSITVLYGVIDETHQSFTPGRTPRPTPSA